MASTTDFKERLTPLVRHTDNVVSAELPIKAGRQSQAEGVSLGGLLQGLGVLTPEFNIEFIALIERLAIYNPEVSSAVNNIVQLGNTIHPFPTVSFDDSVSDEIRDLALTRLKQKSKIWYAYSGGLMSMTTDLLTQSAIAGCISAEAVPSDSLDGIKKIVLVNPKNIRFKYDPQNDEYLTYQLAQLTGLPTQDVEGLIPLNSITYSYIAVQRMGEKPYAIPPFISAMENVMIGKEMANDISVLIKKLGAVGFLEVLLTPPKPQQDELNDPKKYEKRTGDYLNKVIPEIEKGVSKGFVTGFKGEHEFEMHSTTGNMLGTNALITANDHKIMRGLKQDPLMFGENTSTTETLARVVLAKMTTQIKSYQNLVCTFLEKVFLMDLRLAGFPITMVEVEMPSPMVGDKLKDEQATEKKLQNLTLLYKQGIIGQTQFAVESGYEHPDQEEPRAEPSIFTPNDGIEDKKTDPAGGEGKEETKDEVSNTKLRSIRTNLGKGLLILDLLMEDNSFVSDVILIGDIFVNKQVDLSKVISWQESSLTLVDLFEVQANSLGQYAQMFPYKSDDCDCGADEMSFDTSFDEFEKLVNKYYKETKVVFDKATRKGLNSIIKTLSLFNTTVSGDTLVDVILYNLYKDWGTLFSQPQKLVISRNLKSAYSFFRKDLNIFKGADGIPKGTFDLVDTRVLEYYAKSDSFYLGKFVTDEDLKKKITKYIKDEFLKGRTSIDLDSDDLRLMNAQLGNIFEGQEWKLKRIILTTVNKMRNTAAVNYMKQAGVLKFEIVGINDRLRCGYCQEMQGKVLSVDKMITHVEEYTKSDPQFVKYDSPFINSVFKKPEDMKGLSGEELQAKGIHASPFHSNCRCTVVAVIE